MRGAGFVVGGAVVLVVDGGSWQKAIGMVRG